jgi:hypothetical protein
MIVAMTVNRYSCVPKVGQNSPGVDMSKKKRNAVQELNMLGSKESVKSASDSSAAKSNVISSPSTGWWQSLGKVERLAVIVFGLLLVSVAVGKAGLGNKLVNAFSVNTNSRNQLVTNNSLNPLPTSTPQLSKEYIYAGSRLLAVEDANANAAPPADLAVWRPGTGYWYVMGQTSQQWGSGQSGDKPLPGDFDGDGKTDFCVFRASIGTWFVIRSSNSAEEYYYFGQTGDVPFAADFDGDGKTDAGVYRTSGTTGTWIIRSSTTGTVSSQQFGINYPADLPVPADYDGDGKADIAVWRDTGTRTFYSINSSNSQLRVVAYGASGDQPVPADYDGDGKADPAVWRSSDNNWYINQSSNNTTVNFQFGNQNNDLPVPNDYDADGKVDVAVWRFASSTTREIGDWYIRNSSTGQTRQEHWGQSGDKPVPFFHRR